MRKINKDYCKGCNLCVDICPRKVYSEGEDISDRGYRPPIVGNVEECTDFKRIKAGKEPKCNLCTLSCPDQAIQPLSLGDNDE
ncbi:MAG: ferredoxin family protein [Halobacteriota archaeon]|nr:ferredoxin family protein [Halobacteriota archaeon]